MSKDRLLLRDFKPKSMLAAKDTTPQKARIPTFDCHNHFGKWAWDGPRHTVDDKKGQWQLTDVAAAVDMMEQMNIYGAVNLDGGWGDLLKQALERYDRAFPGKFITFAWVDWEEIDQPGFGEKWAKELEEGYRNGVRGLKIFKTLGLQFRDRNKKLILPDDPRLSPIWETCGKLGIPVLIHTADPVAFFEPLDEFNERYEELIDHPDWHFYGKDYPPFLNLMERLLRVVEQNPKTTFIGAHIMGYSENLGYVAKALDTYPNLYVDMTERISELGRQPYTARRFFLKYSDRILFGTDTFSPNIDFYRKQFRFLETDDEYFAYGRNQGRWNIYGIFLPDDVLQKVYSDNARRIIPGVAQIKVNP